MDKPNEPGSARFGNFINYYHFNPAERRLKLLTPTFSSDLCLSDDRVASTLHVLDIGCNSGVSF